MTVTLEAAGLRNCVGRDKCGHGRYSAAIETAACAATDDGPSEFAARAMREGGVVGSRRTAPSLRTRRSLTSHHRRRALYGTCRRWGGDACTHNSTALDWPPPYSSPHEFGD